MFEHLATTASPDFGALRRELRKLHGDVVAFDGRQSPELLGVVVDLARGNSVPDARLSALSSGQHHSMSSSSVQRAPMAGEKGKNVAVISVRGVALYEIEMQPYAFSTRKLARTVTDLANDPAVGAIVLDIATPGGSVTGTKEAADAIYAARSRKGITAIVNPLCASAGYWIASQASQIVAIPSADIGSIGVFVLHVDQSAMLADIGIKPTFIFAGEHKVEGNPLEPLSPSAKRYMQGEVDKIYADFIRLVARGRNTSVATVRDNYGAGRCLSARSALAAGMIDRVETADRAFQLALRDTASPRRAVLSRLASDPVDLTADAHKRRARAHRLKLAAYQ